MERVYVPGELLVSPLLWIDLNIDREEHIPWETEDFPA